DYCSAPLLAEPWILDIDTTVKPLYGHQEGAVVGYNPKKPGRPSHSYHTYSMAGARLVFDVRLPNSREGTRWQHILQTLVCYRLIDPGSEWRLHRQWFEQSAMGDLIGADYSLVEKNALYRCLDKLLKHKDALFLHLRQRWQDLFAASFDVLLYDLT